MATAHPGLQATPSLREMPGLRQMPGLREMPSLRQMIAQDDEPVYAPLVLNPLMARLAEQAGFRALYLGGGSMGYLKTCPRPICR
jgi:hypothetical protein